jgi:Undecaprenyl-phosphate galactose phosphotransferase WbaP
MVIALVLGDSVSLVAAGSLSILIRLLLGWDSTSLFSYLSLWPVVGLSVLAYAAKGLYSGVALNPANELRKMALSTNLVYLTAGSIIFLFQVSQSYSRGFFVLAWVFSLVLVPLGRTLVRHWLSRYSWWGHPVVILGAGEVGQRILHLLLTHPEYGLKPVAVVDDTLPPQDTIQGVPVAKGLHLSPKIAEKLNGAYGILAMPELPRHELLAIVECYAHSFHHLLVVPDLIGFSSLWVEAKDVGGILGLEVRQQLLNPQSQLLKRLVDLIGASLAILLLSPVLVGVAIAVKCSSPGPLFFNQERLGLKGSLFKAFKFRSMYLDAEERLQEILSTDPVARQEYTLFHKLRHDPRVTPVGRIIRKFSLDELPQLWNVIRGEMSLVGPRAYMPREQTHMNGAEKTILQVLPGITGFWQVSGRNRLSFQQRLDLDVYYVKNWSLWFDIHILIRTVWVVLSGDGAH